MLHLLTPDEIFPSLPEVDLERLQRRGVRGLVLDLDNTLVAYGGREAAEPVLVWLREARAAGMRLCILSNGRPRRVRLTAERLGLPWVESYTKPRRRGFRAAARLLGTRPHETAVLGDQIFTDVLGGHRAGFVTVLVNPVSRRELPHTRVVRAIERLVFALLLRRGRIDREAWRLRTS
ncbi:YqeG family HAD IIIA-type phosphatase [Limnochorda pilosa]|uniref:HAD family hydrolase n=1 Tax=Limnochorda pilosa TaxID=1555112 RepID=A0A0K2SMT6_LIMPI|nr:YqeG family HAD IIIA-type phosphatase [Limnochorda pilosa]BAS28443.1 HAD family hydrolase [Limnochorda pilosa]